LLSINKYGIIDLRREVINERRTLDSKYSDCWTDNGI
jgi:hypothetical protein